MSVVAKFYVSKVDRVEGSSTATQVQLGAVCRGIENAIWSQATPSGSITMGILNEAATEYFEAGAEYLVTFHRVTKPAPHDGHPLAIVTTKNGAMLCETCGHYPTWPDGFPNGAPDWSHHDVLYAPLPEEQA